MFSNVVKTKVNGHEAVICGDAAAVLAGGPVEVKDPNGRVFDFRQLIEAAVEVADRLLREKNMRNRIVIDYSSDYAQSGVIELQGTKNGVPVVIKKWADNPHVRLDPI